MSRPADNAEEKVKGRYKDAVVVDRGRKTLTMKQGNQYIIRGSQNPMHTRSGEKIDSDLEQVTDPALLPWLYQTKGADYVGLFGSGGFAFNVGQIYKYIHETGAEVTLQPQALSWTNDLDVPEQIATPAAAVGSVSADIVSWAGAYGSGIDFEIQSNPEGIMKRVIIQNADAIGVPSANTISGGNPSLEVPFIFQKSIGLDIYLDGVLWDERRNTPRDHQGEVEFRSGDTTVFNFSFGYATSRARNDEITPKYRLNKKGSSLFVSILVPYSWIQNVIYPIVIDPTINDSISTGGDDGHEYTGTMVLTSSTNDIYENNVYWFMRMQLDVPQGSTVSSFFVSWRVVNGYVDIECNIWAEDADDAPAATTTSNDISNRTDTTATVVWSTNATNNAYNDSPDLSTIAQEIFNRPGWSANNYMMLYGEHNSGGDFEIQNSESGNAPTWELVYTAPAGGGSDYIERGPRRGVMRGVGRGT